MSLQESELHAVSVASYDLSPIVEAVDVEALASHLTDVVLNQVFSDVIDAEALRPVLAQAMVEKLTCLTDLMLAAITLDDLDAPAALAFAAELGRRGLPEQVLERTYRAGIEALWDWWLNVVDEHCSGTGDSVAAVVRASTPIFFGFVDRMLLVCLDAYHCALSARHQTREHRRLKLVDQLLDGTLVDPGSDAERLLGYAFAQHHLAAVIDAGDRAADKQLAAELKRASHATDLLVIERQGAPTELWLGLRNPMTRAMRAALATRAG